MDVRLPGVRGVARIFSARAVALALSFTIVQSSTTLSNCGLDQSIIAMATRPAHRFESP